jgi:Methylamine utilisation protein MauE
VELIGLYLVACVLLVAAGTAKAIRPADTARAFSAVVSLPPGVIRMAIRIGAVAEAALGAYALLYPRALSAGLVALSYAVFAVVVAYARARGGAIASCGCFGTPDTPATWLHVIVNLGLSAAAGFVAVAQPTGSMVSILSVQPLEGVPLIAASALAAWLTYLVISVLAALSAVRRLTAVSHRSEQ